MTDRHQSADDANVPNRGVIIHCFVAGDSVGAPLWERAYVTNRFPDGVRRSYLKSLTPNIQYETVLTWFFQNYERPQDRYFGFEDQNTQEQNALRRDGTASYDGTFMHGSGDASTPLTRTGGFGVGRLYDGQPSANFLEPEFNDWIQKDFLDSIARHLAGDWVLKTSETITPTDANSVRDALKKALDDFDKQLGQFFVEPKNRWHNEPPERISDEDSTSLKEEIALVLNLTTSMRLAVDSREYSRATAIWATAEPWLFKVSTYIQTKVDVIVTAMSKAVGAGIAALVIIEIGKATGILKTAEAISALLKLLRP